MWERVSCAVWVHSSSEYLRNHWLSRILTTHSVPQRQITGFSANSCIMSPLPSSRRVSLMASLASGTLKPENPVTCSSITPLACSSLYISLVASLSLGSCWLLTPICSIISTAGCWPNPLRVMSPIGCIFSTSSFIPYFSRVSESFLRSIKAM